jgi:hypothetical protein
VIDFCHKAGDLQQTARSAAAASGNNARSSDIKPIVAFVGKKRRFCEGDEQQRRAFR